MTLPRFSVRELLGFVAFLAVGTTALLYASPGWAIALSFSSFGLLVVSACAIVLKRGQSQAFWIGFAVLGWLYYFAHHPIEISSARSFLTTKLLRRAYEDVLPELRSPPRFRRGVTVLWDPDFDLIAQFPPGTWEWPHPRDFLRVGHSLFAFAIAYLGGRLGRYFYLTLRREDRRNEP